MSSDRKWLDASLDGLPQAQADRVRAFRLLLVQGTLLRSLLDRELAPSGVTAQQGAMLSWIDAQPEPPTIGAVAAALVTTHQNVKQIATALARKGFLDIVVDAADRRARRLVPKARHRRFWKRRNADDFAAIQSWLAVWTDDEVGRAVDLLQRLLRHLKAEADASQPAPAPTPTRRRTSP
ncbi:MAG: MarR family winged helix-turn-helix transcriptional regulator [Rubrivivax sp.]